MPSGPGRLPAWLRPEVARGIADVARAVLGTRDGPEDARAVVRAAAVAHLPSFPATMLAELVEAEAPADPSPPEHALPSVVRADAGRLARRLTALAGVDGSNLPLDVMAERLAVRLANAGAARIRGGGNHTLES